MKRLAIINISILLLYGACLTAFGAQQLIEGDWVGTLRIEGKQDRVDVHFQVAQGNIKGTVDLPLRGQMNLALSNVNVESSRIRFEWPGQSGTVSFNGQLRDAAISGEVLRGESRGTLDLVHVAKVDPKIYDQYAGLYEVSPNRLITIARYPPGPVYIDYETGRTGVLFPLSDDMLFGGSAFILPAPIDVRITFFRNRSGEVTELRLRHNGAPEKRARKIKFRQEEVSFRNRDVTLNGTLTLPNVKAPYPVTVRIHGAGPANRRTTAAETNAYRGTAFLSYDKRGVDKSTGDWRTSGFEDLAGDALAAIEYLKSRSDINPRQISIAAGSEGGWVASVVATRSRDVSSITLVACPAISYMDEVLLEVEGILRHQGGFSGRELQEALTFQRYVLEMARTGEALTDEGWAKLEAAAQKVRNERWYPFVAPDPKDNYWWRRAPLIANFDPVPLWEKIRIPVLAVYGELDRNAPTPKNVAALERSLQKAGNKNYLIKIFPKANHEFMEAQTGFLDESLYLQRYVPGFFEIFEKWNLRHASLRK